MKAPPTLTARALVLAMLWTLDLLADDPTARIDARVWAKFWRKRAKKIGIVERKG